MPCSNEGRNCELPRETKHRGCKMSNTGGLSARHQQLTHGRERGQRDRIVCGAGCNRM